MSLKLKLNLASIEGKIKSILSSKSRYDFEEACIALLGFSEKNLQKSYELGELERQGIDAFEFDGARTTIAYQFKGFEVKSISQSQVRQIEKSIKSFSKRTEIVEEYHIVINQYIKDASIIEKIRKYFFSFDGNLDVKLKVHDLNSFFNLLYEKYERFLHDNIWYYNSIIANWIRESMQQKFYHEDVPCLLNSKSTNRNPVQILKNNLSRCTDKKSEDIAWYFVTSEFGYGKTSLACRLVEILKLNSINSIYIPVSNLSNDSFSNFTNLSREILEQVLMVRNLSSGRKDLEFELLSSIFKKHISKENKLVLIFDGLDEHRHCYKLNTIRTLFNSWKSIKSDIVLLLRKEFWDDRYYDLTNSVPSTIDSKELIELTEWDDNTILDYIERINSDSKEIIDFIELIRNGKYMDLYGDIPKRPLFLNMLLDDIRFNNSSKNISSLYLNFFIRKFEQDHSGYEYIVPQRPHFGNLGFVDSTKILLSVMGVK